MKQLTLRLSDELYEEAKRIAEREGFSFNAFAIQAFNHYVKNYEVSKHKCFLCGEKANLELDDGRWICDNCAQIQGELSEMQH